MLFRMNLFAWGGGDSPVADYVVEQGTSGIWTYRKWNSGIAECWLTEPIKQTMTSDGELMGGYAYSITLYFPSDLFINNPTGTASGHTGTGVGWAEVCNLTKINFLLYICGNQQSSDVSVNGVNIIGRWK